MKLPKVQGSRIKPGNVLPRIHWENFVGFFLEPTNSCTAVNADNKAPPKALILVVYRLAEELPRRDTD